MDYFGLMYLMVVAVLFVALVGYILLATWGPRNSVFYVALVPFVLSFLIPTNHERLLVAIVGLMRFTGFLGLLVGGINALCRKLMPSKKPPGGPPSA